MYGIWHRDTGQEHEEYMDRREWRNSKVAECSDMEVVYDRVIREFDAFLAEHGYVRERNHYRVEKESTETVTFFCHFAISCVLLSHLWNVSPFVLWHGLVLAPTSVIRGGNGRERAGNCVFPRYKSRRYFPFICRRGRTGFCCPFL